MGIRLSGELPIQEIATEFGGEAAPNPLSDYYADGTFLAAGYFPSTPTIPSKGSSLNIGAFYGKFKRILIPITYTQNTDTSLDGGKGNNIFQMAKNLQPNISTTLKDVAVDVVVTINSNVILYNTYTLDSDRPNMDYYTYPILWLPSNDETRANGFKGIDTVTIINYGKIISHGQSGGKGGTGLNVAGSLASGSIYPAFNFLRRVTVNNYGVIASGGVGGAGGKGGELITTGPQEQCTYSNPCSDGYSGQCYGWQTPIGHPFGCPNGRVRCANAYQGSGGNPLCCPHGTCAQVSNKEQTPYSQFQLYNECRGYCKRYTTTRNRSGQEQARCQVQYDGNDNCWAGEVGVWSTFYHCGAYTTVKNTPCRIATVTTKTATKGGDGGNGAGPFGDATKGGTGGGGTSPNIATNGADGGGLGGATVIFNSTNIINYSTMNQGGGVVFGKAV